MGLAVPRTSGPSNKYAVGAYFKRLRERHNLTQPQVRAQIAAVSGWDIDESTLIRYEKGTSFPGGEMLAALLTVLGGSPAHITQLQHNAQATEKDAQKLADEWLNSTGLGARIDALFEGLSDEEADAVVKAMMERPRPTPLLAAFRAWWERMRA